jgi:hypothetical protein
LPGSSRNPFLCHRQSRNHRRPSSTTTSRILTATSGRQALQGVVLTVHRCLLDGRMLKRRPVQSETHGPYSHTHTPLKKHATLYRKTTYRSQQRSKKNSLTAQHELPVCSQIIKTQTCRFTLLYNRQTTKKGRSVSTCLLHSFDRPVSPQSSVAALLTWIVADD